MKDQASINNNIFGYAFMGALLFIATVAFLFANLPSIAMLELSYIVMICVLATSSFSLLYKAIKHDKNRLSQV